MFIVGVEVGVVVKCGGASQNIIMSNCHVFFIYVDNNIGRLRGGLAHYFGWHKAPQTPPWYHHCKLLFQAKNLNNKELMYKSAI